MAAHLLPILPSTNGTIEFIDCPPSNALQRGFYYGRLAPSEEKEYDTPEYKAFNIPIHDVRGHEREFQLQTHGFCFLKHSRVNIKPTSQKAEIEDYITKVAGILQEQQQADLIFCYDYKFRRNDADAESRRASWNDRSYFDPPAREAHVDATWEGGMRRIRSHLSESEAAKYLDGPETWRLQIINSWQPVEYGVEDRPLTFCDYFSTRDSDYIRIHLHISKDGAGELYHLRHDGSQNWYWLSGQTHEELIFFLNYDSLPGSGPKRKELNQRVHDCSD